MRETLAKASEHSRQALLRDMVEEKVREMNPDYASTTNAILGVQDVSPRLIAALDEPLVHLLRNAVDHGIEGREERVAAGKGSPAGPGEARGSR